MSHAEWRFHYTSRKNWWNLVISMVTITAVLTATSPSDGFIDKDETGLGI